MEKQPRISKKHLILIALAAAILILAIAVLSISKAAKSPKQPPEIISVSALEKIINVSELSTFTAVYNGIAEVQNETDPTQIDYYVSYEARVDAGIDFEKIEITVDSEAKEIRLAIPDVYITEINVDISTLDFIFINEDANTSTVTQEAFKECEADVKNECAKQEAILTLAEQNAENVLTALVNPIIEQLDAEYELIVS